MEGSSDDRSASALVILFTVTFFIVPAACVTCTFLPMLHNVIDTDQRYQGPVPDVGTPATHGSSVNYYKFDQPLTIDSRIRGSSTLRIRTKNGYRYEYFDVTPITARDLRQTSSTVQTNLWACSCKRQYGCRNFPAIDVGGFSKRLEPWRYQWVPDRLATGVRVRSRFILSQCRKAARDCLAGLSVIGTNATLLDPSDGGAFVEMADLSELERRLKIIIFTVGAVLDFAALVASAFAMVVIIN